MAKETYLRRGNIDYRFEQDDDGACWVTKYKNLGCLGTFVNYCKQVEKDAGNELYKKLTAEGFKREISLAR